MSPSRISLGTTDNIEVFPLCLGGNVFGWTADETTSLRILDSYLDAGGNFLDTADGYSRWVPGHTGGESETIIGKWLSSRRNRDQVVVSTKVFSHPEYKGLRGANIKAACDASLRRLQTDYIDVYYAHRDDPDAPMEETLTAFTELIKEGKVRIIGASNFSADRLAQALDISKKQGLAVYQVTQDHYNLVERGYEQTLRPIVDEHGMTELPYYALASGFLTGKYRERDRDAAVDSARGGAGGLSRASDYLDDRGKRVLTVLDSLAAKYRCHVASIALAWLIAQPTVGAPVASARTVEQLPPLVAAASLTLTAQELAELAVASNLDNT